MHIAEVVTIAKSLPLLRLNTYKSLILSYSADYRRIFGKKHYICTMENIIQTFTKEEQAIFIVALFLLLFAIVMSYAMVQDYRIYLDENYKARYSFCDFIKRERYYIYLFLVLTFVIILGMTVYIMAIRGYM